MTDQEINTLIDNKFESLKNTLKDELLNLIEEKFVKEIKNNKTFYNSEELSEIVRNALLDNFEKIFQDSLEEFRQITFYIYDDSSGREDLNLSSGICKTGKLHLLIEKNFKTVDCGFIIFEKNLQFIDKVVENLIRRTITSLVVGKLNELSAKIVEENAIISTDNYGSV